MAGGELAVPGSTGMAAGAGERGAAAHSQRPQENWQKETIQGWEHCGRQPGGAGGRPYAAFTALDACKTP